MVALRHVIFLAVFGLALLCPPAGYASANVPVAQGELLRGNARITFEWPQTTGFSVEADGSKLAIKFERRANPSLGQVLAKLYPYVKSAQLSADGKVLTLTTDKAYKIRTFEADRIAGLELLGVDKDAKMAAELAPAAGETASPTAEAKAEEPAKEAAAEPAAAATPTAALPNDSIAGAKSVEEESTSDDGKLKVSVSSSEDNAVLRFPLKERMDVAAFIRNNALWVVFGKKVALNLNDFPKDKKAVLGTPELIEASGTVLRVPVQDGLYASVARDNNSLEWAVLVAPTKKPLQNPLKIAVNTEPPAPPHVFVNALELGEAITLKDPVIGDEFIVVPMFTTSEGMPFTREFVDFRLLESAQGLVVVKRSDGVAVSALRNGMRITVPQGAVLTPGLPEVEQATNAKALQIVPTLFPHDKWSLPPDVPERAHARELMSKAISVDTIQEANDLRLRAAQIYLNAGLGAEAMGLLEAIRRTDGNFYRSSKLAAMNGAASFLMSRYADAARYFAAPELNNNKEIDYWRNMLEDLTGKDGQYNFLELNNDYISRYPPLMRQKLAIVAADRNIDSKEFNTAIKIFESLKGPVAEKKADDKPAGELQVDKAMLEGNLIAPISQYVNYLMAKIAADTGQTEESILAMSKLAEDYKHPYVRSRADYARIIWQMNRDIIKKDQVIEQMERLRLSWHGDSLELKVLEFLGTVYSESKDYLNAMRIWDAAVQAYAGTPRAIELQRKLEETFVLIFKEGIANKLPPLEALALYYQYKNYAPPGSIGRDVINNLADRLISVDLLEQAASLLEHQMRHDSEKIQRSQLGAKVATVHLTNHEPQKALRALQDSVYGENPLALHQLRNRLAAQALMELGENERAWQVLANDDSPDAESIRLDILWERRDWARVIPTVENLLRTRKDITAPVSVRESEQVIKLALAYLFENNREQLQYLRDYFTPLMTSSPNKPLFDYITSTDVIPTPTNFEDVLKNMLDTRNFISQYKAYTQVSGKKDAAPTP